MFTIWPAQLFFVDNTLWTVHYFSIVHQSRTKLSWLEMCCNLLAAAMLVFTDVLPVLPCMMHIKVLVCDWWHTVQDSRTWISCVQRSNYISLSHEVFHTLKARVILVRVCYVFFKTTQLAWSLTIQWWLKLGFAGGRCQKGLYDLSAGEKLFQAEEGSWETSGCRFAANFWTENFDS